MFPNVLGELHIASVEPSDPYPLRAAAGLTSLLLSSCRCDCARRRSTCLLRPLRLRCPPWPLLSRPRGGKHWVAERWFPIGRSPRSDCCRRRSSFSRSRAHDGCRDVRWEDRCPGGCCASCVRMTERRACKTRDTRWRPPWWRKHGCAGVRVFCDHDGALHSSCCSREQAAGLGGHHHGWPSVC